MSPSPSPSPPPSPAPTLIDRLQQQHHARVIETHISWVLLDGADAWKLKKPLKLPFLDASTLERRRELCEEELRLNRRMAASLYLEVTPITGTPDAPALGGSGPVIDYAVHMRQFPHGALLSELLASDQVQPAQLDEFALKLAAFHRTAPLAPPSPTFGSPNEVERTTRDVLRTLADLEGAQQVAPFAKWLDEQAPALRPMWAHRQAQGRIVEGHGDLHLANVVLLDGALTAFDCIEFDPALRWIDPLSDAAFLVMDLMAHDRADLAFRFLNSYLDASGEHAGVPVLRQYLVYRALVRAMVARIKAGSGEAAPGSTGSDYLALAHALIQPTRPRLLITHGVSGSGKTYVSQGLLEQAGAIRIRSDVERKRLFSQGHVAHIPMPTSMPKPAQPGLYNRERTLSTYAHLRDLAHICLQAGWPVIVDATFLDPAERDAFRHLATSPPGSFTILHCQAPRSMLESRIKARQQGAQDASDADTTVLAQQLAHDTALRPDEAPITLHADTLRPDWAVQLASQWLAV